MAVSVTLLVFSGKPDPDWTLSLSQEKEFRQRLGSCPVASSKQLQSSPEELGYRGFAVHFTGPNGWSAVRVYAGVIVGAGFVLNDLDRSLERWLLASGTHQIDQNLSRYIDSEISASP